MPTTLESIAAAQRALTDATTAAGVDQQTIHDQAARIAVLEAGTIPPPVPGDPRPTVKAWSFTNTAADGLIVIAAFSEQLAPASVSAKDCTLIYANAITTAAAVSFTYDDAKREAAWHFGKAIAPGSYKAKIPASGVTDVAGQSMAADAISGAFTVTALTPTPPTPGVRDWPTRPTPPNVPTNGPTIATASKAITASTDFAGANYVQLAGPDRVPLFDVKSDNVKISRFKAFAKDGLAGGFDINRPGVIVEDAIWTDNSGWLFTVRATGKGATIRRQRAYTFARYFGFFENVPDVTVEDVEIDDTGADGIPGTPDDDGGSDYESLMRGAGAATTITFRRIRLVYGPKHFSVKAGFRGEGVFDLTDIFTSGAIDGVNPLGAGDGGMGELLDRAGSTKFSNPDQVRAGVRAFQKANPNATPMDVARYIRSIARVWNDPTSAATQQAKGDKAWNPTDAQLQGYLDSRKAQLAARSTSTWRRYENQYGYALEAGSVTTFEGTVIVKGDPRNGSCPFSGKVAEYPPGPKTSNGVETDPGWRFTFDVLRPAPVLFCKAAADGTLCRFYGDTLIWTLTNDQAKSYIKGKFYFNDVLFDWS